MPATIELTKLMRHNFILATAILFAACNSGGETHTYFSQGRVIVDSTGQGKEFLAFDQNDNGAYYPVYYLGRQADTLFLGRQPISMFTNGEPEHKYDTAKNWNSTVDMKIDIVVDTTLNAGHDVIYSHFADDNESEIIDSTKSIKAYTIFITNLSDSLVMLGSHNFVGYLTREVQDKDGSWNEVDHRLTGLCGTAKRSLILEPNDVMVAKLLRYHGDTKYLCRLKLSIKFANVDAYRTYSNVYMDYFDKDVAGER
jgi:hypothetical protein